MKKGNRQRERDNEGRKVRERKEKEDNVRIRKFWQKFEQKQRIRKVHFTGKRDGDSFQKS